jgi:hypothetical protein
MVSQLELKGLCRKFEHLSRANPEWEAKRLLQAFLAHYWIELRHHGNPELLLDMVIAEVAKRNAGRS